MRVPPSPFKDRLKGKAVLDISTKSLSAFSEFSGGALVKPAKQGKLPKVKRSSLWCKNLGINTKEIKVTVGKDGHEYCYDYAEGRRVDCEEEETGGRDSGRAGAEGVDPYEMESVPDKKRRPNPKLEQEKEEIILAIIEIVFSNYPEDEHTETRKEEAYSYLINFSLVKLRKIYQDLNSNQPQQGV